MRLRAIVASLLNLSLAIISTTFVLLAANSKQWAVQKYYFPKAANSWTQPLCVTHRSPFYRCDVPSLNYDAPTNNASCAPNFSCQWFRPYGANATSCRVEKNTNGTYHQLTSYLLGTDQQCQQVHYAGNLQIAASVFITLGLIILLTLTSANVAAGMLGRSDTTTTSENAPSTLEDANTTLSKPEATTHHNSTGTTTHRRNRHLSTLTPPLVLITLCSLYIGILLQVLAQYFGILSLVTNESPTADTASSANNGQFGASEWTIDVALSTYASVAWFSALLCGLLTAAVYRVPRFPKLV